MDQVIVWEVPTEGKGSIALTGFLMPRRLSFSPLRGRYSSHRHPGSGNLGRERSFGHRRQRARDGGPGALLAAAHRCAGLLAACSVRVRHPSRRALSRMASGSQDRRACTMPQVDAELSGAAGVRRSRRCLAGGRDQPSREGEKGRASHQGHTYALRQR